MRLRRWSGLALWLAAVVACVAVSVVAVGDRDDAEAAEQAALAEVAADVREISADGGRVERLQLALTASRQAQARDQQAAKASRLVIDEVGVLRERLEAAQGSILDATVVSDVQRAELATLRACVQTLDVVRAAVASGDDATATSALDAGRGRCQAAEELADGIVDAVHPFDFPDPDVLAADGTYYAFGTNGPGGDVQVLTSPDLDEWTVRGPALVAVPFWARPGLTWAPAVIRTYRGYLLYYTVRHAEWGQQCITVARSDTPAGPYVDASWGPLICQTDFGGSIDPSPYQDEDGSLMLTWKSEGETVGQQAILWAARLSPEGTAVEGASVPLATTDRAWEGRVVEAPSMARIDGTWVLVYSGHSWQTDRYAVGYARCLGPMGPCAKPADNVALASTDRVLGPGGAEVFRTAGGRPMVAYAGWDRGDVGPPNPRRLHLAELRLTPEALTITP